MIAVPCFSLLRTVQAHDSTRPAITDRAAGLTTTFGALAALALRFRRTLARLGLRQGETVACSLPAGPDLSALLLACSESGLHLRIMPPGETARDLRAGAAPVQLLVDEDGIAQPGVRVRQISAFELGQSAAAWSFPDPADTPAAATVTAGPPGAVQTASVTALLRSAGNFAAAYPAAPGQTLLTSSPPFTLDALCMTCIIPLVLGLHAVLAGETAEPADMWELPAERLLLIAEGAASVPDQTRWVFCGSGRLRPADIARVEAALGRRLQRGYGTLRSGFWAIAQPDAAANTFSAAIRPLRSPLLLIGAGRECAAGEVILRPADAEAAEQRTGDVGWMTPQGVLAVVGTLSGVSVRAERSMLLSDIDRLLLTQGAICESRTFRETGTSPTERVVSVCATEVGDAPVRDWLVGWLGPELAPDRIVTLPAERCQALPPVEVLRSIVNGTAGQAVVTALTARRFRRNPAYDEAGLAQAAEAALLSGRKLEFLMFWGCGPRRTVAAPDRAAIDALADLLAAAEAAAPLQARAHVICTDLHATSNGHEDAHFLTYFSEIRSIAAGLDVEFELESAAWRRGGLSKGQVQAYERMPDFEAKWQTFPLQSRFIQQASRHSHQADKVAAARHYYATCLLERDVLKSLFGGSVFLTYNGPDFNECFPDLPTLYVYPGPRGRNDKPWFVDADGQRAEEAAPEVATVAAA